MSFRKTSHARTWRTSGTWEWHRFNELFFCLPDVFYRRSQRPSCLFGAVYFGHFFMTRRGRPLGGSQAVIATLHRSVQQTSCGRRRKRSSAQTWIRPSSFEAGSSAFPTGWGVDVDASDTAASGSTSLFFDGLTSTSSLHFVAT